MLSLIPLGKALKLITNLVVEGRAELGRIDLWVGRITEGSHANIEDNPSLSCGSLAASSVLGGQSSWKDAQFQCAGKLTAGTRHAQNRLAAPPNAGAKR